jgi:hypothetical protein
MLGMQGARGSSGHWADQASDVDWRSVSGDTHVTHEAGSVFDMPSASCVTTSRHLASRTSPRNSQRMGVPGMRWPSTRKPRTEHLCGISWDLRLTTRVTCLTRLSQRSLGLPSQAILSRALPRLRALRRRRRTQRVMKWQQKQPLPLHSQGLRLVKR